MITKPEVIVQTFDIQIFDGMDSTVIPDFPDIISGSLSIFQNIMSEGGMHLIDPSHPEAPKG